MNSISKIIIISILTIMISSCSANKVNSILEKSDLKICNIDSDCVIVEKATCCTYFIAINKKYENEYNQNFDSLKSDNSCENIQCIDLERPNSIICEFNICVID